MIDDNIGQLKKMESERISSEFPPEAERTLFNKLIWTIEDVCRVTTYSRGTIYNLVSRGSIPYYKPGKKLFFIPHEIISWIKQEE